MVEQNNKKESKKSILIFGTSRSGKSSLASLIRAKYNYTIINLDNLLQTFYEVLPEAGIEYIIDNPNNKKIAKFTAKWLEALVHSSAEANQEYIIEGDSILPSDVIKYFDYNNCIVIFLAQNKLSVDEIISNYKKYNKSSDWTNEWTDEELKEHAKFHLDLGKTIEKECAEYNLYFRDTSYDRESVFKEIIEYIDSEINLNN